MSLVKLKLSTSLWVAALALAFIALTPILQQTQALLASGGQTASPNPSGGLDQEERVRRLLVRGKIFNRASNDRRANLPLLHAYRQRGRLRQQVCGGRRQSRAGSGQSARLR